MTRARAPGKVVLSGAYAVLSGAPALVSAVSRFVIADSRQPATFVTEEVRAALEPGQQAPWFDANALRENERKLGLGSSAAILVASLFALERDAAPELSLQDLRQRVFVRALEAHQAAQGGGSGVDVAASTFGGTLSFQRAPDGPHFAPVTLPAELRVEVWACPSSASTRELLAAVRAFGARAPGEHAALLGAQAEAARAALTAIERQDADAFVAALSAQHRALLSLGRAAGVPIVTPELAALGPLAEAEGGVVLPAGAGGGDIALYAGRSASSPALRTVLQNHAHELLRADLGAAGVGEA